MSTSARLSSPMKVLKSLFLVLAVVSQITVYASYAPKPLVELAVEPKTPPRSVRTYQYDHSILIEKYALKWQIQGSEELMKSLIRCESSGNPLAHALTQKEDSWGVSQINLLAHTNITKEQATDPDFAIDFMAKHIASGDAPRMWYTCYKKATQ